MLVNAEKECGCRGCQEKIRKASRISWVEGVGPFHLRCTPLQQDKIDFAEEYLGAEKVLAEITSFRAKLKKTLKIVDVLCFVGGPVLISANMSSGRGEFFERGNQFFFSVGVGLVAFGLLKFYWQKFK